MPMALENLAIAQHRDTLRYAYLCYACRYTCRFCICVCRHKPIIQLTIVFLLLAELRGRDPQLGGQLCACACLSLFCMDLP